MSQNNIHSSTGEFKTVYYHGSMPKKKIDKEKVRRELEKKRERDSQLVTGRFINLENKGGWLKFGLKLYPGEPFKFYCLWDNELYTLPRGVVNHLRNECYYLEYKPIQGELRNNAPVYGAWNDGRMDHTMQVKRKVHRFAFEIMDLQDDELDGKPQNDLVMVERTIPDLRV